MKYSDILKEYVRNLVVGQSFKNVKIEFVRKPVELLGPLEYSNRFEIYPFESDEKWWLLRV